MEKNIVKRCRPLMSIWRMRIECWIPKATDTHTEYVILIAFPQQRWLHERASLLRYTRTYIVCLVLSHVHFVSLQRRFVLMISKYSFLNLSLSIRYTGLFISLSGISELDCATTKTDTAERSISIGRESLQVFFCTRVLGVLPGSTAKG